MLAIAALVAIGPARPFAEPGIVSVAYFLMVLFGFSAVLVWGKRTTAQKELPQASSSPVERPSVEPAEEMEKVLAQLGIPLDMTSSDSQTALMSGLAKSHLYQGYQALQTGRVAEAIQTCTRLIDMLSSGSKPRLVQVLAVAYYLRGSAYESQGVGIRASGDYAQTLQLWPEHQGAQAGANRLRLQPAPLAETTFRNQGWERT